MKLLIDANLAPRIAVALQEHGHEAVHVGAVDLLSAPDDEIFQWAATHAHVVITADSDFAMMLAIRGASEPSVVQLRDVADKTPDVHTDLLVDNLPGLLDALEAGAIVSLSPTSIRIRDLPIA